jgi:hypothetical protein
VVPTERYELSSNHPLEWSSRPAGRACMPPSLVTLHKRRIAPHFFFGGGYGGGETHNLARADYMEKERVGLQSEHQEEVHADTHGAAAGNI